MTRLKHTETIGMGLAVHRKVHRHKPLAIGIGCDPDGPLDPAPYYWRQENDASNLIEVGIEKLSGRFLSFNLVNYSGNVIQRREPFELGSETFYGIPRFDLGYWPDAAGPYDVRADFYDTRGTCQVEMYGGTLRVMLFPEERQTAFVVATGDDLVSEFNASGELVAIRTGPLTPADLPNLAASIGN